MAVADGKVTIQLSNGWRSGGELVVILRDVETAIPSTLPSLTGIESHETAKFPYFDYQFTVKSRKTGRLDSLDPILIDHDGDDANNNRVKDDGDTTTSTDLVGQTATARVYSKQPSVRVGNILGEKGDGTGDVDFDDDSTRAYIQYYGPDLVDRAFGFMPMDVYAGESDIDFTMTFEAKGPMYAVNPAIEPVAITVPIPEALRVSNIDATDDVAQIAYYESHIAVTATGRVRPSGRLDAGSEFTVTAEGLVTINFSYLNMGAKVTLTYDFEGGEDTDYPNTAVGEELLTPANDPANDPVGDLTPATNESLTAEVSAFTVGTGAGGSNKLPTIMTLLPARTSGELGIARAATSVSGAQIRPIAGSGTIVFTRPSDAQVEAGEDVSKLTLTYEAATMLSRTTLRVLVDGIQLEEDPEDTATRDPAIGALQMGDPDGYGYVSGSDIPSAPGLTVERGSVADGGAFIVGTDATDLVTRITWSKLNLEAGKNFVTTIEDVRIVETGGAPEFTTSVNDRNLAESPQTLYHGYNGWCR